MDAIYFYTLAGEEVFVHIEHGICRLTFDRKCPDVCFVSTLIVNESSRQHGIGKQLLRAAELIAKRKCCNHVSLQVENNSWKKEWYKREGYDVIADGYDEGMIIMSKEFKED